MKKTFEQLVEIDYLVGKLYKKDTTLRESKFGYAYNKFYEKNIKKIMGDLKEAVQDINISNALEDEKTKAIIHDKDSIRGFAYSKEGLKAVIKAENELTNKFNAIEVEIIPCISTYVPELTEEETELLKGCII